MSYVSSFERYYEKRGLEKGMEKGIERGIEKGIEKGQATLLQGQLIRKFGPLSPATQQRLDNAKPGQLEVWSLNILDADTLDYVFAG